ncbi:putative sodium-dependent multivitamin transporter [Trichonephila inaurata madagascariensis]|uniref:Putative sodium-dependent multivitamin transporter n=1 Tax=Trichonephila inaurata madagascariensis TaxID=2747483 RepID=A0A8X6YCR7_9ARAC|nr:putative sodium-dependent multivitamin transporter [Trichonephila inaurata madagascariensis]
MIADELSIPQTQVFEIVTGTLAMRKVLVEYLAQHNEATLPHPSLLGPPDIFSVPKNKIDAQGEASLTVLFMKVLNVRISNEEFFFPVKVKILDLSSGDEKEGGENWSIAPLQRINSKYLEKRFCKGARLLVSTVFIIQVVIYMAIILYAPAIALNAVTGLSKWTSVFVTGLVCTFYSTLGGMKAVLWTDLFQALLMFSAVFAVAIKGTMDIGGLSEVWRIAKEGERIQFFNFDPDPTVRHTFWTLVIGGFFTYLSVHAVNQAQVQRLLTVRSLKESQIATGINVFLIFLFKIMLSFAGIVIYANLSKCDPLLRSEETNIYKADQILPYFVMTSLTTFPGLPGLFIAGVSSACLSSVSSAINSLAAVTVEDFLFPLYLHRFSESKVTIFTKLTALSYGIICISLTFIVDKVDGIYQFGLMLFNVIGGPTLGIFSLGMLFRKTTAEGAITGFVVSLFLSSAIGTLGMIKGHKTQSHHRSTEGCPGNDSITVYWNPEYANQTAIGNSTFFPQHLKTEQE